MSHRRGDTSGDKYLKKPSLESKVKSFGMYIDGEWVHSKTEEKIDVVNPTTERVIGRVPRANREEVKEALEAARDAQPKWEDTPPIKRASFLFKIAQLIRRDKERLAEVLTAEQGKPLFESRLEIEGSAENFEYYAEFARRIQGDVLPSDNPRQSIMILKLPLGVVASITPWNFPSAMAARKIAPALITGNTVVTKPSSNTPLSTVELVRLAGEAALPKELRIGDPMSGQTDLGPMVSEREREVSAKFVQQAREEGGKVIIGGQEPQGRSKGWFYEPTVIEDVGQKSSLVQNEIFGPVVPVLSVDSFDRAIEFANDSKYGLASYVFTKDNTRVLKAMHLIKFGECYINQVGPEQLQGAHTGFRQSGLGAEGSKYGLEMYTQLKTCYVDWNDKPNLPYLFPYGRKE